MAHSRYYSGAWIVVKVRESATGTEYLPRGGFNSHDSAIRYATDLRNQQPHNHYEVVARHVAYPYKEGGE